MRNLTHFAWNYLVFFILQSVSKCSQLNKSQKYFGCISLDCNNSIITPINFFVFLSVMPFQAFLNFPTQMSSVHSKNKFALLFQYIWRGLSLAMEWCISFLNWALKLKEFKPNTDLILSDQRQVSANFCCWMLCETSDDWWWNTDKLSFAFTERTVMSVDAIRFQVTK